MVVQNRQDNTYAPFIIGGEAVADDDGVITQDAGRTTVLAKYTLLSRTPADKKWIPFTDETAVDGTQLPIGVLISDDIAAADIVAGDVGNHIILRSKAIFDRGQLVIENSKTLDTVITSETMTVSDWLISVGLVPEYTTNISELENS
jgi:hypothetical protein